MAAPAQTVTLAERRFPRLIRRVAWLQRHGVLVTVAAAIGFAVVFALDFLTPATWTVTGFYLLPLTLVAVALRRRATAIGAVATVALTFAVMTAQGVLDSIQHFLFLYFLVIACGGLVILADLLTQLDRVTARAVNRARFAEAEAEIVALSTSRTDLDELLQTTVERIGEQIGAENGIMFGLRGDEWVGLAGYGFGHDAREIRFPFAQLVVASEALEQDRAVIIDDVRTYAGASAGATDAWIEEYGLRTLLIVPLRAFVKPLGVITFNRATGGRFTREQVRFAESVAGHVAAALENARLMTELDTKRRDLSMVVESSLDLAASLEPNEVLEAVVVRLVNALDVTGCDIDVVVEPGRDAVLNLVGYDENAFDYSDYVGQTYTFDEFTSTAHVVETGRSLAINDLGHRLLSDRERRLMTENGQLCQLSVPLKARDRVIGVAELFDRRQPREFSDEEIELAEAICQFAALALDNARLYEAERDTSRRFARLAGQLEALQEVSLQLNRKRNEDDVLQEVVRSGARLLGAGRAAFVSGEPGGPEVTALYSVAAQWTRAADDLAEVLGAAGVIVPTLTPAAVDDQALAQPAIASEDALVVPIKRRTGESAAALVFANKQVDGGFSDEDRRLATTLAAQLSLTLANVGRFRREQRIAETFQEALRPKPPKMPGTEIGVRYQSASESARIGGDFYDIVALGPNRFMVAVGDVCGRGLQAAVQTAMVRYMLRAYAAEGSPGECLSRLNATIMGQNPDMPFVTVVVAYFDVARHSLDYAVAGHPRPIVFAGRHRFPIAEEGSLPVGIFANSIYATNRGILPEDATIVLYTDGLTEARREGQMLGEKRVVDTIRRHQAENADVIARKLMKRVQRFARPRLSDDIAIVTVKMP